MLKKLACFILGRFPARYCNTFSKIKLQYWLTILKIIFRTTSLSLALSGLITIFSLSASNAITIGEITRTIKNIDLVALLGLGATLLGTYFAIVGQQEERSEKRYEEFKEYVLQENRDLKLEVSSSLKNLFFERDQFETKFWEELELADKHRKESLLEMKEKLALQDGVLRSLEIMIASHKDSFGHDAMIKVLIETKSEICKLRAEISIISTIDEVRDRIENLERLVLKNIAQNLNKLK